MMKQYGLRFKLVCEVICALALLLFAGTANGAEQARHQERHRGAQPQWHGNIAYFHEHDWQTWRGGHWSHERHGGRLGWWWVIGPSWYFYPTPIYPYPNPWEPAEVLPAPSPAAPPVPPTEFWYYCEASRQYYPYVSTCPGGWKKVPATPEGGGVAPVQ